jgi:uridylate kinase
MIKMQLNMISLVILDVLTKDLKVMDASAISLARENNIPILVCSIIKDKNLAKSFKWERFFHYNF